VIVCTNKILIRNKTPKTATAEKVTVIIQKVVNHFRCLRHLVSPLTIMYHVRWGFFHFLIYRYIHYFSGMKAKFQQLALVNQLRILASPCTIHPFLPQAFLCHPENESIMLQFLHHTGHCSLRTYHCDVCLYVYQCFCNVLHHRE